tara:strand:+ start:3780 stop:5312 length:1533 start_codon:yes stop_codon:yes gene_type:complete
MTLSKAHIEAVHRVRRVILNYDSIAFQMPHLEGGELIDSMFGAADLPNSRIDSIFWNWGEGNFVLYKSKILEPYDFGRYPRWLEEGFDPIGLCHKGAKERGLESFFSLRINGSDSDRFENNRHQVDIPKFKREHPEYCIYGEWSQKGRTSPLHDFSRQEVRDYKVKILKEVLDLYDFDGIEIDYARVCPVLPPGQQWTMRDELTKFQKQLREAVQEKAAKRNHPILIAVRIPETIAGCHWDGIDIESWVRSELVDILCVGCRSFEVEHRAWLALENGHHVEIYPCIDDIHASDGYRNPPIEVFRGVFANWMHQGFQGIQTFNFQNSDPHAESITDKLDQWLTRQWTCHKRVYEELSDAKFMAGKKTYVIQRRLGGHAGLIQSFPWNWKTPRWCYSNTNMEAQLPAKLHANEDQDVFLHMYVASFDSGALWIELSEPEEIVVRLNGVRLWDGEQKKYWIVYNELDSAEVARGDNLIQIALRDSQKKCDTWIEKVELREWVPESSEVQTWHP